MVLGATWSCRLVETAVAERSDFIAYRGDWRVGEIEIKVKRGPSTKHRVFYIDRDKVTALVRRANAHDSEPIFAVQFDDGVWWVNVRRVLDCPTSRRGRDDRGDRHDLDVAYLVPRARMRLVT